MRALLFSFATLIASNGYASTNAFFSTNKVVIVIQGPASDTDASRLYDAMEVPVTDGPGIFQKKTTFASSSMVNLFDLSCKQSKALPRQVSCTLQVYNTDWATIDAARKYLILGLNDNLEGGRAAKKFAQPNQGTGEIFRSSDNHVLIQTSKDEQSGAVSFTLSYQE